MREVVRVGFKQVYDLVFRARNARLNATAYVLDYHEWMKAGIAFNTRGFELSTRKISYFVKLYEAIQKRRTGECLTAIEDERHMFEESLVFYYEDIFDIYQDHLESKQNEYRRKKSKSIPDFGELLILPCFDGVPELREVFPTERQRWDSYECKDKVHFVETANSAYLREGTGLFTCMSMMYDYGIGRLGSGTLVEVELWDNIT